MEISPLLTSDLSGKLKVKNAKQKTKLNKDFFCFISVKCHSLNRS